MASTYPTQSQPRRLGDLIVFELHPGYDRISALVKNTSGAAVDLLDPVGYPVKAGGTGYYDLAFAGDEGSVIGLILFMNELSIGATTGYSVTQVPVLVRGPVVIDPYSGIPASDGAGSAFTLATIITSLAALSPPIISISEPSITAQQTS